MKITDQLPKNEEDALLENIWEKFNKFTGEEILLSFENQEEILNLIREYGTNQYVEGLSK